MLAPLTSQCVRRGRTLDCSGARRPSAEERKALLGLLSNCRKHFTAMLSLKSIGSPAIWFVERETSRKNWLGYRSKSYQYDLIERSSGKQTVIASWRGRKLSPTNRLRLIAQSLRRR